MHPKNMSEFNAIIEKDKLSLVDFFASWCGPCKMIAPYLEKFATTYTDVQIVKVDVDDSNFMEAVKKYKIHAMPTFKFIKKGNLVAEVVGANPDKLEQTIKKFK